MKSRAEFMGCYLNLVALIEASCCSFLAIRWFRATGRRHGSKELREVAEDHMEWWQLTLTYEESRFLVRVMKRFCEGRDIALVKRLLRKWCQVVKAHKGPYRASMRELREVYEVLTRIIDGAVEMVEGVSESRLQKR